MEVTDEDVPPAAGAVMVWDLKSWWLVPIAELLVTGLAVFIS